MIEGIFVQLTDRLAKMLLPKIYDDSGLIYMVRRSKKARYKKKGKK